MAFPVNTLFILQSPRASQQPIEAADPLHTFSLAHASAELSSKITLLHFSPSDQLAAHSLRLSLRDSVSTSLHPELHIERIRGLTSWSYESHLNRCSSWADTQASPHESVLLLQQERGESGSRQWCDKLRFLIFIPLIYSFPLQHCHPSTPPPPLSPSSILFPISLYPLERKAYSSGNEGG